jgi:hypothetical protein
MCEAFRWANEIPFNTRRNDFPLSLEPELALVDRPHNPIPLTLL